MARIGQAQDVTVLIDEGAKLDTVKITWTRPTCCTVFVLLGFLLSFGGGYLTREHQASEEKVRVSELEQIIFSEVSTGLRPEWEYLTHVEPGAETCEDGLLVGGPVPDKLNLGLMLFLLLWAFIGVAVFSGYLA